MQENIEKETKRLISILKSKNVPDSDLNLLTTGESFEKITRQLQGEVAQLPHPASILVRVLAGEFGSGKSHMLTYLSDQVRKASSQDVLFSKVDLGKLREAEYFGFQFQIMKGLYSIQHATYQEIIREIYDRIYTGFKQENPNATSYESKDFVKRVVASVVSGIVPTPAPGLFEILIKYILDLLEKIFRGGKARAMQFSSLVQPQVLDQKPIEFVDAFSDLAQRPRENSAFEELAKQLSYDAELTNVLFKLMKQAGFKVVIIFVDELEALSGEFGDRLGKVLTRLREFHDEMGKAGRDYPAIALIVASTPNFLEDLKLKEPALYSRWYKAVIEIPFMSDADIDDLILRVNSIFDLAGYDVKPMPWEIAANFRQRIIQDIEANKRTRSTREVIGRVIYFIETEWINQRD